MSSSSSPAVPAAAPTTPLRPRILSWNIACCANDEAHNPLYARLPLICSFLRQHRAQYDILCIQEIRPTGGLSAMDVVNRLRSATGHDGHTDMMLVMGRVNPKENSFYRATMYDAEKWLLVSSHFMFHLPEVSTTTQKPSEQQSPAAPEKHITGFLTLVTEFIRAFDLDAVRDTLTSHLHAQLQEENYHSPYRLCVYNVHAPVDLAPKQQYWTEVFRKVHQECVGRKYAHDFVVIGDLNKFPQDREIYRHLLLEFDLRDLLPKKMETFRAFSYAPKDPHTGETYVGSLDGVVVTYPRNEVICGKISVFADEDKLPDKDRSSDHFPVLMTSEGEDDE